MKSNKNNAPIRVVTVGDASVGKTSLTSRLVEKTFNAFEPSTVGANYQTYSTEVNGDTVELQIWDTAGQEKYKSLAPIYFRNAAAAVVVFSLISRNSYDQINDWITSFVEVAGPNALIYIAANKSDLNDEIEISSSMAKQWALDLGYKYYETSAKTGFNVNELFNDLAADIQKNYNTIYQRQKTSISSDKSKTQACC